MAGNVKIDSSSVEQMFDSLTDEKQKEILMKALKKGANYLQMKTKETLVNKFPKANTAKGKANKPMVQMIKVKEDKQASEVIVSIMKHYLNVWFEMGTTDRYRKIRYVNDKGKKRIRKDVKGGYTGKIKPLYFFTETQNSEEDNIINVIQQEVEKEIKDLNK